MSYVIPLMVTFVISTILPGVENPNVGSPTAVPSANRPGLIRSQPHDAYSGNDVVTGHVGGGKHFRGTVPYSSGYYSGSVAGSSVDAFLRRASDPLASDRAPGQYRSYYNPRQTTASFIRPDGASLSTPSIGVQGQIDPYTPPMLAQTRDTQYSRQRPLSMTSDEVDQIMSRQMQLREEMQQRQERPSDAIDTERTERVAESVFFQDYLRREELTPDEQARRLRDDDEEARDRLPETPETDQREPLDPALLEDLADAESDPLTRQPRHGDDQEVDSEEAMIDELISETDKAQAAALLSRYGTFENLAKARVAEYLAAGEALLNEGRFYKAADMFALAALWDAKDARAWAGRAFALFAAGEYMSSAFHLSQAILRNPDVASQRVDLAALIGDRDVLENRIIEMTTWQERSGSGELAFMMAFVLYHDGKPGQAREAIRTAAEKMPDDKAVRTLRDVILPGRP